MADLLSKSSLIRSMQCVKSLYLHKKYPQLRDPVSEEQQAIFSRGHEVGSLARQLFPGGTDVGWNSPKDFDRSVSLTAHEMASGAKVLYEASFLWNDVLVAADI